jgi:lipid-A-disaccharide synthase
VWAWNRRRVKKIKRTVDAMKVVFPFEVDLYRSEGIDVEFVGHPLVERLESNISREEFFRTYSLNPRRKLLALLPGSRLQEVRTMLPVMVEAARRLSEGGGVQAAIGVAPNLGGDAVRAFVPAGAQITVVENATYDLMKHADTAIVTSGTATLETGWFGTPMVVVYKTSFLTYLVGRMLVRVPHIGLVNIVAGKQIVPEFVQHEMTPERLVSAVGKILGESSHARRIREELAVIRQRLGAPGASSRVAEAIIALGGLA